MLLAWSLITLAAHADARFHPDEALYMTAARSAAVQGDWLLIHVPQDKPPLTMYANAFALTFFGVHTDDAGVLHLDNHRGEFAGRLVSMASALVLVALVIAIARRLWRNERAALLAGALLAVSGYQAAFSATAFTDMPMTMFGLAALLLALRERSGWAGTLSFLAFASKPQGIFFLPLVIVIILKQSGWKAIWRSLLPWGIGGVVLIAWDGARVAQGAIDVWTLGRAHYTEPGIAPIAVWRDRLLVWLNNARWLYGDGLTGGVLLLAAFSLRQAGWRQWLLAGWIGAYSAVHIVTTVPLYDRYLLPLAPMLALLAAGGIVQTAQLFNWRRSFNLLMAASGIVLLGYALVATQQRLPIGGDLGQHTGIDQLADYLNEKPIATVIYDPWLGWELGYYLGPWTNKRRVHYPTPDALVKDALELPETGTRYFVAPKDADIGAWLDALSSTNFDVAMEAQIGSFVVVTLTPPDHP
ncbi:MAG: glycosyltransferase family 39 protein [Anaerolineae bacterium]|nr:glycosyltransferase family 39 protein [Anaerolineae bacterium]